MMFTPRYEYELSQRFPAMTPINMSYAQTPIQHTATSSNNMGSRMQSPGPGDSYRYDHFNYRSPSYNISSSPNSPSYSYNSSLRNSSQSPNYSNSPMDSQLSHSPSYSPVSEGNRRNLDNIKEDEDREDDGDEGDDF